MVESYSKLDITFNFFILIQILQKLSYLMSKSSLLPNNKIFAIIKMPVV